MYENKYWIRGGVIGGIVPLIYTAIAVITDYASSVGSLPFLTKVFLFPGNMLQYFNLPRPFSIILPIVVAVAFYTLIGSLIGRYCVRLISKKSIIALLVIIVVIVVGLGLYLNQRANYNKFHPRPQGIFFQGNFQSD